MLSIKPDRTFISLSLRPPRALPDRTVAQSIASTPALADLVADHGLGGLVLFDHPGHRFPGPGVAARGVGAGAELADQHDLVALRIVEQNGARLAALEHLAADDAAHAAVVQRVTEEIAEDF